MESVNKVIGKNLCALRKREKLTQLEFAEKFNYSDKTISKWETGESLPSIDVLYEVANFYNVSLDALVSENDIITTPKKVERQKMFPSRPIIALLSTIVVWLLATIGFVLVKLFYDLNYYMCFLWAIPVSCVIILIFSAIWTNKYVMFVDLSVLNWATFACLHLQILLTNNNIWPVYFICIPLQVAIILWAALLKRPRKHKKKKEETEQTNLEA